MGMGRARAGSASARPTAAPGKFEVKSHGSLSYSSDCKLFPLTAILPQTSRDLLYITW